MKGEKRRGREPKRDRERETEKFVVICGASRQSLKSFLVTVRDSRRGRGVTDSIRADSRS